jgi:hypothetical protein
MTVMRPALELSALEDIGQVRGVRGDDVDRFVEVRDG